MSVDDKRAALAKLLKAKANSFPLSYGQTAMWFQQHLNPENTAYNIPLSIVLNGIIDDVGIVKKSIEYVVSQHSALRTRFKMQGDEPIQSVIDEVKFELPFRDLSLQLAQDWQKQIREDSIEQASLPFDLENNNLFRVELLKLSDDRHVIQFTIHHIVFDGWSVGIFLRDFGAAYVAYFDQVTPPIRVKSSYRDFVVEQRKNLSSTSQTKVLSYWQERLHECQESLTLPTDKARPEKQSFAGAVWVESIDASLSEHLIALAKEQQVTLFVLLLSCVYVYLGKLAGQNDVVLGVSQANRDDTAFRDLVGLCSEVLPMRGQFDNKQTFSSFLAQVQKVFIEDLEHANAPLSKIMEHLKLQRDPSRNLLFQAGFDYQNTPWPESLGNYVYLLNGDARSAKLDLNINISKDAEQMFVLFEYNTDLFNEETAKHMTKMFIHMLGSVSPGVNTPLEELSLVTPAEQLVLKDICSGLDYAPPTQANIIERLTIFATDFPDEIAIEAGSEQISYAQLMASIAQLSGYLRANNVCTKQPIALNMAQSSLQIISMLSVIAIGGSYLPLDVNGLSETKLTLLKRACCQWLLQSQSTVLDGHELMSSADINTVNVSLAFDPNTSDTATTPLQSEVGELVYVLFTSGSTGTPKGVMVSHSNLSHYCMAAVDKYGFVQSDRSLQFANYCFDTSVEEIFPTLWAGATVVLRPQDLHQRLTDFWQYCAEQELSMINLPTTFWHNLMDELDESYILPALPTLRQVVIGGEAVQTSKVQKWFKFMPKHIRLLNTYGPTETTVAVTIANLNLLEKVKTSTGYAVIGKPLPYTQVCVLDENKNLLPRGVYGEIVIAGPTVAKGYLGQKALTEEKFNKQVLFDDQEHDVYRTGDIGRFNLAGDLEFKGRVDNQVKIRGYRVELTAVDAYLRQLPLVTQATTANVVDGENSRLVAWVTLINKSENLSGEALREALFKSIADYLVPDHIVIIESFPLTISGKINAKQLVNDYQWTDDTVVNIEPPVTETEKIVVKICSELLVRSDVGINHNFFSLGGHSLLLSKLVAKIRREFDTKVPIIKVYDATTLAELAEIIDEAKGNDVCKNELSDITTVNRTTEEHCQLTPSASQRRLWFLQQLEPSSTAYLIPLSFEIKGELDADCLEYGLNQTVKRHEILRTRLISVDGAPFQEVVNALPVSIKQIDLSTLSTEQQLVMATEMTSAEANTPIAIDTLPSFRAVLIKFSDQHWRFLFTVHHILADAWTMALMLDEIGQHYHYRKAEQPFSLPVPSIHFGDYANWQNEQQASAQTQQGMTFWHDYLEGMPRGLSLPYDRAIGVTNTRLAGNYSVSLSNEVKRGLYDLIGHIGGSMYTLAVGVLKLALAHYTNERDIVIGTVVSGREHPQVEKTLGFFANTMLLRTSLDFSGSTKALLKKVNHSVLNAQQHQQIPFDDVVRNLPFVSENLHSIFQVMFLYEKSAKHNYNWEHLDIERNPVICQQAKFSISISLFEQEDCLDIEWEYAADLFDEDTIAGMSAHFNFLMTYLSQQPALDKPIKQLPLSPQQADNLPSLLTEVGKVASLPSIGRRFIEQRERCGEHIALVADDCQMSYVELDQASNQMSHWLFAQGVKQGETIGLCLTRKSDLIIAMLAVVKSGFNYVPLDSKLPQESMTDLIGLVQPRLILSHQRTVESLASEPNNICRVIDSSNVKADIAQQPTEPALLNEDASVTSHLILTSGSTGKPKAVEIQHANVISLIRWAEQEYDSKALARVLAGTAITFDLSIFEIFVPLCTGHCVVLVESPLSIIDRQIDITLLNTVPSVAQALLDANAIPDSVNVINLAGEPLTNKLLNSLIVKDHITSVYNLYGPSEDTTYSTFKKFIEQTHTQMTIGHSINNSYAMILDQDKLPLPTGATGEIYLGGAGVAKGYFKQAPLTAESFILDPFSEIPLPLYRTGDFGCVNKSKEIVYLGRRDQQVKLRGYRIELEGIRRVLLLSEQVKQAVVIVKESNIHAFVTPEHLDIAELENSLQAKLPSYMLPAQIHSLKEFELNSHGKVDLKALQLNFQLSMTSSNAAITGDVQKTLEKLWRTVLPNFSEPIFQDSSFFKMGGHSLIMVRLHHLVQQEFSLNIAIIDLLFATTIYEQSELIRCMLKESDNNEMVLQEW
jgi:amino acid adenylation domain-containing protein